MAFLDKKITELAFVTTPGQDDRIAIVNLGVTKQTSVSKFLQSVVAATGSFFENASITGNQITFTRADSTTLTLTIASASFADTSISASHALSADDAISSSYAVTSSYSLEALSSSFAAFATSASYALSSSFADFATSASYAVTASHALNVPETASYSITSSYSLDALSASFAAFATSASYAVTASHALNVPETASYALTASFLDAPVESSSYAESASRVGKDLTNGLGVETLVYNGSVAAQVQLDTASAHFTTGVSASQATTLTNLSASFSTSQTALSSSASTAREAISSSLALRIEAVSQSAATDIVTNSASIAALSQSAAAERLNFVETSSIIGAGNIIEFTKGDKSTYINTIITSSFVKSVNGINPDPTTGNVNTSLTAVSTGTSASMLAASSSGNLDNGEVWIIAGQTGGDPVSGSGSNGESYIFDSGSGLLYKLANTDQAENDVRYVIKSGDTMTGQLLLNADPTLPLGAAPKQYVDRAYISSSIDGITLSLFTGTTPAVEHSHSITNAISASYAVSASHSEFADSGSYALTSSHAVTASYAISASHVEFADSSSYAVTSSHAITASYTVSSSHSEFADSASYAVTSSHAVTASFITGSNVYGPFGSNSIISSSHALTASIVTGNTYRENVAGDVRYSITHNLNEQYPVVQTYDTTTNRQLIPDFVESTGLNTLNIEYAVTFSGIVIVQK